MGNEPDHLSTKPTILRLPVEILDHIAAWLVHPYGDTNIQNTDSFTCRQARCNLIDLSLSTRRFTGSAQRVLFRMLVLRDQWYPHIMYAQFYRLLRTLLDRPDLARRVKSVMLDVQSNFNEVRQRHDFINQLTKDGRPGEYVAIIDKAANLVESSALSFSQREKWEFDVSKPWTAPICGIILCLLTNLEQLTIMAVGRGKIDDDREPLVPLFGGTYPEDRNYDSMQSPNSYEQQLGISGRPDLRGIQHIAGLARLKSLKLITQPHIIACGLRHLPRITSIDISVRDSHTLHYMRPTITYTKEEREEFQNIEVVRFDASVSSIERNINGFLSSLTCFIIGLPKLRHLTIYGESEPFDVNHIKTWSLIRESDLTIYRKSYRRLITSIAPSYQTLESLSLPAGLWTLPSSQPQPPAVFSDFANLQYLAAPRQAFLGTRALELPSECLNWDTFYRGLLDGKQWLNDDGSWRESLDTRSTNPEQVELGLIEILPRTLRHLKITGVDDAIYLSLRDMFRDREDCFPNLERVELWLADECQHHIERLSTLVTKMAMGSGVYVSVA